MFQSIETKLKNLAKVVCWVGFTAFILAGLFVIFYAILFETELDRLILSIVIGVTSLFSGPLLTWILSLFIYGFGELIDQAKQNAFHSYNVARYLYNSKEQTKGQKSADISIGTESPTKEPMPERPLPEEEAFNKKRARFCSQCGTLAKPGEQICSHCKHPLV